jgi:hypothetical protein
MKLDPGFITHWKTERLISDVGPEGVVALLRLWGNAQIRRRFTGLNLTPKRLALEARWSGDEKRLWDAFTDADGPWLDQNEDGTFSLHGFEEHQHQVIKLWENGKKGGRPPKGEDSKTETPTPTLPLTHPLPLPLTLYANHMDSISKPNGNHMVSDTGPETTSPKHSEEPKVSGPASSRKHLPDEVFLAELKRHYPDIDFEAELRKMDAWLMTKPGKKKTRRFVVNWLNRVDPGIKVNGRGFETVREREEKKTGIRYDKPLKHL